MVNNDQNVIYTYVVCYTVLCLVKNVRIEIVNNTTTNNNNNITNFFNYYYYYYYYRMLSNAPEYFMQL